MPHERIVHLVDREPPVQVRPVDFHPADGRARLPDDRLEDRDQERRLEVHDQLDVDDIESAGLERVLRRVEQSADVTEARVLSERGLESAVGVLELLPKGEERPFQPGAGAHHADTVLERFLAIGRDRHAG